MFGKGCVMADFELSAEEQGQAAVLWLSLLEAKGDAETVARLMDGVLDGGSAVSIAKVLSTATALQFVFGWPIILRRLEELGVSADDMLTEIGAGMGLLVGVLEQVADLQGVSGFGG